MGTGVVPIGPQVGTSQQEDICSLAETLASHVPTRSTVLARLMTVFVRTLEVALGLLMLNWLVR